MTRKFKAAMLLLLVLIQVVISRYPATRNFNVDLLYLILVYIAIKSGYYKTIFSAAIIGLAIDYLSINILGVFGFSRTISAYLLHEISPHIDLKNNIIVFLLISVSLCISNFIANLFFYFIQNTQFNFNLILYQPVLTGVLGIFLLSFTRIKKNLDVY